jgi:hypothetical protein
MTTAEEFRDALRDTTFSAEEGWEAVHEPDPRPNIVLVAHMPAEWTDEILAEAQRRGMDNPLVLICDLVRESLDRNGAGREPIDELRELLARAQQLVERLPRAA